MADRIVQGIFLIIALFFAATNWHTYIQENGMKKMAGLR